MTGTVLGILGVLTLEIWAWALAYVWLGVAQVFSEALSLSTDMFSTIGYGAIPIAQHWHLITALEGINGFLMIGWSTAYLVAAGTRHGPFRRGDHF
jgi:hypothetical protein